VPEVATVVGEFEAVLVIVMPPLTLPVAVGAKVIVSVAVWCEARTWPLEIPLAARPGPDRLTVEMVTLELPLFVNVTDCVASLPNATLPNAKFTGVAVNVAGVTGLVTLKVIGTRIGDPASSVAVAIMFPV
jgi:hypothetical protein